MPASASGDRPVTAGVHGQAGYDVRLDWGPAGARALAADARPGDVAVVVDVLSFTTTLTVALERGILVHPYPWAEADAASYAEERAAVLATGRRAGLQSGALSLSPRSFDQAAAVAGVERVVLPSPNGSSIAFGLADAGVTVVGACLRNASAVAAPCGCRPRPAVRGRRGGAVARRVAAARRGGPVGSRRSAGGPHRGQT